MLRCSLHLRVLFKTALMSLQTKLRLIVHYISVDENKSFISSKAFQCIYKETIASKICVHKSWFCGEQHRFAIDALKHLCGKWHTPDSVHEAYIGLVIEYSSKLSQ